MGREKRRGKASMGENSRSVRKKMERWNPQKKVEQDIAYQNKDITSKMFAEQLKGKSLQVYGVDTGRIRAVLPTNIPAVKANELRLDNLLKLEDGTVALVDYESEYKRESKGKYLNYLSGIVNRYEKEGRICPNLRMIVVYTRDIRRDEENAKAIRRVIQMTKVAMIFEREKEEAVRQAVEVEQKRRRQAVQEEKKRGKQAIQEEKHKYALRMIADGDLPMEKIAEYLGLDIKVVAKLAIK